MSSQETLAELARKELLDKATERGYEVTMHSGDKSWYALYNERYQLSLQLSIKSEGFELVHMKGIVKITTGDCGSFMSDEHFNRIEREIRKIVVDLL